MGQGEPSIPPEAYFCRFNKRNFNKRLDIIRDAHEVSQFYAELLLEERLPITLPEYKNYSDATEEYFNPTRKQNVADLGMSYAQFYQYLNTLQMLYEKPDVTDKDRTVLITDVFKKCYIVQRALIEDLWYDCSGQNIPPAKIN